MKRRLLSHPLTALLTVATLVFSGAHAQESAAAPDTIIVQQGDTAYSIARRAGLTLEAFMILNGLNVPDLKIGQTVIVRSGVPQYTVQPGDTLYSLARKYGLNVDALKAANQLPQDGAIAVGQVLKIPTPGPLNASRPAPVMAAPTAPAAAEVTVTPIPVAAPATDMPLPQAGANWRDTAMSLMGTPYVLGGTTRRGTDCSGLVLQVFGPLGVKLPRVSADQARSGVPVNASNLQPGDLVFFDTAGGGRVTHVGIYLGGDQFINANSYKGQVSIDRLLSDKYWAPRFVGARRVLADNIMASQP